MLYRTGAGRLHDAAGLGLLRRSEQVEALQLIGDLSSAVCLVPLTAGGGEGSLGTMMAVAPTLLLLTANRQTFETCIALTLQMLAAIEFAPALSAERPTRELLLDFAAQVERNAADIARMDGHGGADIIALGENVYRKLTVYRDEPLRAAYHALHSAAFLGLEQGLTTATMLSAVAYSLRVLAQREGQLLH